jgi:hypothetical protein
MNLITGSGLMIFFGVIFAGGIVIPVIVFLAANWILIAGLILVPWLIWRAVQCEKAEARARYIRTGR